MKKLFALLALASALLLAAPAAFAAERDYGFDILDYAVNATVHENNTVTQTETITVRFNEPRHGIYRAIPETVYIEKETADGTVRMPYKSKIRNFSVPGFDYSTERENGFFVAAIGSEDIVQTGVVEYQISFTVDIGDDRVPEYDELFYTLFGTDFTAPFMHCSFSLSFDKPLPEGIVPTVYSGTYGAASTDNPTLNITAIGPDGVRGESTAPLGLGEGITVHARLPEGYFSGERTYPVALGWAALGVLVLLALAAILYSVSVQTRRPVQTVEFYPPSDVTSAEVGFIVDGVANDKDILSLIIYLADKGHLTIAGEENALILTRAKPLAPNAPHYMLTFYNALFEKGETCDLSSCGSAVYQALQAAKSELAMEFTGARKLSSSGATACAAAAPFAFGVLYFVCVLLCTAALAPGSIVAGVCSMLCIGFAGLVAFIAKRNWNFASMGKRAAYLVGAGVLASVGFGLAVLAAFFAALTYLMPFWVLIAAYAAALLGALSISRTAKPTAYYTEIAGKLMGLKSFIQKAELSRITLLCQENPSYFYSILPYAYVFDLSDVWMKQFESLSIAPPSYYTGSHLSLWNLYWITRALDRSYTDMIQRVSTEQMQSGGHGGTSFGGGGGGFSGGGFGGGGGGSW